MTIPEDFSDDWFDLLSVIIERTNITNVQDILNNTLDNIGIRDENIYNRENKLLLGYLKILKALLLKFKNLGEEEVFKNIVPKLLDKTISEKSREFLY